MVQEHRATHAGCTPWPRQMGLCHPSPSCLHCSSGHTGSPSGTKSPNWDGDQGHEKEPPTGLTLNPRWHFLVSLARRSSRAVLTQGGPCCPRHKEWLHCSPCPGPLAAELGQPVKPPVGLWCQGTKYLPIHGRHKAIYALFVLPWDFFSLE